MAYLVQEYVSGEALDASLRQYGPPPIDHALITLGGLAEALDRAAGEGIHHGCLHPRDVIVSPGGEARVIDLGVAEALQRAGLRAPVRRPYSSPERVEGRPWGGPADIFALGAIAYELVTGRRVPGPGVPALAVDTMTGLDQNALGEALGRALEADPSARFASASDLVDVLRPVLARARRVSLAKRRPRPVPEGAVPLPLDHEGADPGTETMVSEVEPAAAETPPEASAPTHDLAATHNPAATHDPADLPLTIADARTPALAASGGSGSPPRRTRAIEPVEAELSDEAHAPALRGAAWHSEPAEPVSRWALMPLLVALVLGVSAGFGLGYWAAWRAAVREHAAIARTQTVQETSSATRVDEPPIKPEEPPPARSEAPPAGSQASKPEPAPTPAAAAARPRVAAAEPAVAAPERARPKRESAPPGKLLIRSTPPGARVMVDGRQRGRTPLILRDLPLRVTTVTLTHAGFKPSQQRVALSAAKPTATVDARLEEQKAEGAAAMTTGSLFVESRPSSATVFVDNRSVGATPIAVPDLSPGYHRVRLELEGFTSWVTMAEVKVGGRTRVSASLEQGSAQ